MSTKILLALAATLLLVGCSSGEATNDNSVHEHQIDLSDGRTVTCLTYRDGYAGGLTCDWATAH